MVDDVAVGWSGLRNLRADLARRQAGRRPRLASGAARDALGGALFLILLALSLVRRGFLMGGHYLALRFRARDAGAAGGPCRRRHARQPRRLRNASTAIARFGELVAGSCRWAAWFQRDKSVPFGVPPQLRITRAETSRAVERAVKEHVYSTGGWVLHWTFGGAVTPCAAPSHVDRTRRAAPAGRHRCQAPHPRSASLPSTGT